MNWPQKVDYKDQIEETLKRAKCKKVFYLYNDQGYKLFFGVFNKKKATEIKRYLRRKNLINRLSESEVKTNMPDTNFKYPK